MNKSISCILLFAFLAYYNLCGQKKVNESKIYLTHNFICATHNDVNITHIKLKRNKITLFDINQKIIAKSKYNIINKNAKHKDPNIDLSRHWKAKLEAQKIGLILYLTNANITSNLQILDINNSESNVLFSLDYEKATPIYLNSKGKYFQYLEKIEKNYYFTSINLERENRYQRFLVTSYRDNIISIKYGEKLTVNYSVGAANN